MPVISAFFIMPSMAVGLCMCRSYRPHSFNYGCKSVPKLSALFHYDCKFVPELSAFSSGLQVCAGDIGLFHYAIHGCMSVPELSA